MSESARTRWSHVRWLWVCLAVGFALRCFYFVGTSGFDDISYVAHALELLDGSFTTAFQSGGGFPFRYRAGVVYPTALMFRLFGTSEYAAAVLPMLNSLGLIWLCWRLGRMVDETTGLLAAILMATFPMAVVSAGTVLAGPFGVFFCGLSVLFWLEAGNPARDTPATRAVCLRYFACGLSLGIAYLFRIEAGLYAIVFAALALWHGKPNRGWLIAGGAALSVVFAENLVYWSLHGTWLYRLRVVSGSFAEFQGNLSDVIRERKSAWMFVRALFLKPTDLGLHGAAFTLAAFAALIARRRERTPFVLWFWPLLLYLSFGTWSLTAYVPTTKDPRYLMNVSPPGLVLLASILGSWMQHPGRRRTVALMVLGGVLIGSLTLTNILFVYRSENAAGPRLAAAHIKELEPNAKSKVWCEHHTASNLVCFLPEFDVQTVSRHELALGIDEIAVTVDEIDRGYVVVDHFLIDKYTDYSNLSPPDYLFNPPSNWRLITKASHPTGHPAYAVVRALVRMSSNRLPGLQKSLRPGPVLIYKVAGPRDDH